MNANGIEIKNTNCLAGRMDAIAYLKTKALPGIIKRAEKNSGKSPSIDDLKHLSATLSNLPDFTKAVIQHKVVGHMLEEEFPGCKETKQCIESYAANVPEGIDAGIYYDAYEQVLRTLIGMKVYLKTELPDATIMNNLTDKREAVRNAAIVLKRYNTPSRIFDLPYVREAIGNAVRETGHTKASAKMLLELILLIEKCIRILEGDPEFSDIFADYMERISETAISTGAASEVAEMVTHTQTLVDQFNTQKLAA